MDQIVNELIDGNKVMVFSKDYCPFCDQAKELLKQKRVQFEVREMDLIDNGDMMHQSLKRISGQNTVPVVYIGGKKIGGCDDLTAADSNGKLDKALKAAGVEC